MDVEGLSHVCNRKAQEQGNLCASYEDTKDARTHPMLPLKGMFYTHSIHTVFSDYSTGIDMMDYIV